jgi:ParB family chromosome partitioning protein
LTTKAPYKVSAEVDAIESKALAYSDEDRARAGALVMLTYDGSIRIERGLVRKEDVRAAKRAGQGTASDEAGDGEGVKPKALPTLTFDLSRIRTAMIQAAMTGEGKEQVALATVAHAFALAVFYEPWDCHKSPLDLSVHVIDAKCPDNEEQAPTAFEALEQDRAGWKARLPQKAGELLAWCYQQPLETLLSLLASVAARTVNAKVEKHEWTTHRHDACDRLADELQLDPHAYASLDRLDYFGRTPKAHILDMLKTEVGAERAANCAKMKKAELADTASEALTGKWLPAALMRTARGEAPADIDAGEEDDGEDEGFADATDDETDV